MTDNAKKIGSHSEPKAPTSAASSATSSTAKSTAGSAAGSAAESKAAPPKAMAVGATPKHDKKRPVLNFDVSYDSLPDLAPIAEVAWDNVRGKDTAFADSVPNFQQELINHAQSALKTGPQAGSTYQARFEQEVVRLRGEFQIAKEK